MSQLAGIDSVYMLMAPGWRAELRSNRWHFGRRWAGLRPVVMVQPDRPGRGAAVVEPELRIPGCEILSVQPAFGPDGDILLADGFVQAGQIARHMEERGHVRPLLWMYDVHSLAAYALLPASLRVFHATENYFDFEGLGAVFQQAYLQALEMSDCVIAASTGVAEAVTARLPAVSVLVSSNGCDYEEYSKDRAASPRFEPLRSRFPKVAIYAGNVNARVDFPLLSRCAREAPEVAFAFVGPVSGLGTDDRDAWAALLRAPNVQWFGPADPDELPALYRAADVGIIPYRRTPMLERNGFPLKALEMAATELPVVSTFMKPLEDVRDVVRMVDTPELFVAAVREESRGALSPEQRALRHQVCSARSYGRRFAEVVGALQAKVAEPATRADTLARALGSSTWRRSLARNSDSVAVLGLRHARRRILVTLGSLKR